MLQMMVVQISQRSLELVFMVWEYIENVLLHVIDFYYQCYLQLQADVWGVVQDLILKRKNKMLKTYCNLLTSKVQFIERLRNLMRDAENMSCGTEYAYSVPWIQIMLMMVHCIIYWWYTMYMYLTLQASTNGESVSTVVQRHGQVRST